MKKLFNKKGFTLAELLIVVAIIGVLTVVAVPVFTTQLEKSREATDIANMREAKAAAASAYLSDENVAGTTPVQLGSSQTESKTIYFDANNGKVTADKPTKAYGKGTAAKGDDKNDGVYGYDYDVDLTKSYIKITVTKDGECTPTWEAIAATP